jgi:enoyl-CoA hydratase/carnithine racemase
MNAQAATAKPAADAPMLLREDKGGIAILTLNRPQARNSLSEAMLETLGDALTTVARERSVRVVILAANGPAFCAGHDLKEITARRADPDRGRAYFHRIMTLCSTAMEQIVTLPQPVIAAVHATATAAGCQLVASCDLAVASQAAKFATPGVNIGLFCSTPMVALSRNVSRKHAMEMLLTGDLIAAEDALRIGLVNHVVAPGSTHDEALALAQKIAAKSALTVKIGKEAFYRQAEMPLAEAYKYTSEVMVENMLARDAEEGISAFIEKREPKWQDR